VQAALGSCLQSVAQRALNPSLEQAEQDSYRLKVVIGIHSVLFAHFVRFQWLERDSLPTEKILFVLNVPKTNLWELVLLKYNLKIV
jgi:hypothetical protein